MPRAAARRRSTSVLGRVPGAVEAPPLGFVPPCLATLSDQVPARGQWIHEIKHDGSPYSGSVSAGAITRITTGIVYRSKCPFIEIVF